MCVDNPHNVLHDGGSCWVGIAVWGNLRSLKLRHDASDAGTLIRCLTKAMKASLLAKLCQVGCNR